MGVIVDRTPKCHCKLAGEGVDSTRYTGILSLVASERFPDYSS